MRIYCLIALVALSITGGDARADDAAAAETTFQRGKAHMQAGRYAEACADFALSVQLDSSDGTLLNLGECNEKLGKTASAWAAFKKAAVIAGQNSTLHRRRDYARKRATALEPRLTQLELRTGSAQRPAGFKVSRNGVDSTLVVGVPVPVDPGTYTVEAVAPGFQPWRQEVPVDGEGKTVVVEIPALSTNAAETTAVERPNKKVKVAVPSDVNLGKGATAPSKGSSDRAVDYKPQRKRRVIAMGVGGVGAAAVATGLVFGSLANSRQSDSEEYCNSDNACSQTGFDLVQDARSAANISTVLVGVGVASVAAGVALWLTAPSQKAARTSNALRAVPTAGRDSVGLVLLGDF